MLDVTELDAQTGGNHPKTHADHSSHQDKQWECQHVQAKRNPVPEQHGYNQRELHEEIDKTETQTVEREDDLGKIDFGDQAGICLKAIASVGNDRCEKLPENHPGNHDQAVGNAVRLELEDPSEQECQDSNIKHCLDKDPCQPDCGLLVAYDEIPPYKK